MLYILQYIYIYHCRSGASPCTADTFLQPLLHSGLRLQSQVIDSSILECWKFCRYFPCNGVLFHSFRSLSFRIGRVRNSSLLSWSAKYISTALINLCISEVLLRIDYTYKSVHFRGITPHMEILV